MSEDLVRTAEAVIRPPAAPAAHRAHRRAAGRRLNVAALVGADAAALVVALVLAGGLAAWVMPLQRAGGPLPLAIVLAAAVGMVLPALWLRLYVASALSPLERFRARVLSALLAPPIGLAALSLAPPATPPDAVFLFTVAPLHLVASLAIEGWARQLLLRRGLWGDDVVVIGAKAAADALTDALLANPQLGLRPVANRGIAWLSGEAVAEERVADIAVVAIAPGMAHPELSHLRFGRIMLVPAAVDLPSGWTGTRDLDGQMAIEVASRADSRLQRGAKRVLDLLVAVPALLLTLPVIALACAAICVISPGSPIYVQRRVGWLGRPVAILKLRSMYPNAERRLDDLLQRDPAARAEWMSHMKLRRDPRVLPVVGDFIRRTSIDELPQLWNVIRGNISLVGPRPFPAYHVERFDPAFQQLRCSVRPGLTGLWQVTDRSGATLERQQRIDTHYIRNWSLWLDLYIVFRTVPAVLSARGAH